MAKLIQDMELFKVGNYGAKGTYTEKEIDNIIKNTLERKTDIPIIIGHKEKGKEKPALAWMKHDLFKRVGGMLSGTSEVLSETLDTVKKFFRHRSVGLNGDGNGNLWLDHVALLGSSIPEVKGLKAIGESFYQNDDKLLNIEFKEEVKKMTDKIKTEFTEDQINLIIKGKLTEQKSEFAVKFSEQETKISTLESEKKILQGKLNDNEKKFNELEVENLVDGFIKDGKIDPAKRSAKIELFTEAKSNQTIFDHLKSEMTDSKKFEFGEDKDAIKKEKKSLDEFSEMFGVDDKDHKKYEDGLNIGE